MEIQPQTGITRRRSDRVSIAFPVEASGIDPSGKRFSEPRREKTTAA